MAKPTLDYIYKLVPSSSPVPDPLPEQLPLSELDAASGFIHLSTAEQIPGTLKHFFAEDKEVYVLRIPYAQVEKDIKWEHPDAKVCGERGDEGFFPHLYNSQLGSREVDEVAIWRQNSGNWEVATRR
ncbi:hypothetical protein DFH06DRAFT_1267957 [Mycena polygramma]|nr:hypothetical protein DFH06DRAFT_1267957 [Mycena polygramma]